MYGVLSYILFVVEFVGTFVCKFKEIKGKNYFRSFFVYLRGILGYFDKQVYFSVYLKLGQFVAI